MDKNMAYYSHPKPLNPWAAPYRKQPAEPQCIVVEPPPPPPPPPQLPQVYYHQPPPVMYQRFSCYNTGVMQQPYLHHPFPVNAMAPPPSSPTATYFLPSECRLQQQVGVEKVELDQRRKKENRSINVGSNKDFSLPPRFRSKNKNNSGGKTSLMIRNIPNQFERLDLLHILDGFCMNENRNARSESYLRSEYDFLYLPMDFRRRANLGYAFVNFTNAAAAARFRQAFHKFKWNVTKNKKICEISFAHVQGKEALRKHFQSSVFSCHTDEYLPVVLSPPRDGCSPSSSTVVVIGKRGAASTAASPRSRAFKSIRKSLRK